MWVWNGPKAHRQVDFERQGQLYPKAHHRRSAPYGLHGVRCIQQWQTHPHPPGGAAVQSRSAGLKQPGLAQCTAYPRTNLVTKGSGHQEPAPAGPGGVGALRGKPSLVTKDRVYGQLSYRPNAWRPRTGTSLSFQGDVNGAVYSDSQQQAWVYGRLALTQSLGDHLTLSSTYRRRDVWGARPSSLMPRNPCRISMWG